MIPLFFSANVFYSYQQNQVNGETFNIRTRSLNGALYWIAQMFGGLLIGLLLDLPFLSRPNRARLGWVFLLVTGMAIWGGGYAFQEWQNKRIAQGLVQDLLGAAVVRPGGVDSGTSGTRPTERAARGVLTCEAVVNSHV